MTELTQINEIVFQKDMELIELSKRPFGFAKELERLKDLFRTGNEEHPPTCDTSELKAKIDANYKEFNEIAVAYYKAGEPDWMRNAFTWILSEARVKELLETNPTVFEKNLALIELCEGILRLKAPLPGLLGSRFKDLFIKAKEGHKPTLNTSELKDEFDKNYVLFNEIANYYHQEQGPDWLKEILSYILSEKRMNELLETHPTVFAKNEALLKLSGRIFEFTEESSRGSVKQELSKCKDLFSTDNRKHQPTLNLDGTKKEIDQNTSVFDEMANAYRKEGKPGWMLNIFELILSEERLTQLDLDKFFKDSVLSGLFARKQSKGGSTQISHGPLSAGNLAPYLHEGVAENQN
jgi:hypothetical protein